MIIFSNKEGGVNMDNDKQYFLRALGMNIKRLREEKNLSQEELANLCGYSESNARSSMSKIEKGINDVPASKLKVQLAEILKNEGFIKGYKVEGEGVIKNIVITLKYKVMQGLLMNEKYSAKEGLKNA